MSNSVQTTRSDDALYLPEALDMRSATSLAASVLAHQGNQLLLNGSKVKKVGAQCLQILVSAARMWERDGVPFALAEPSEELKGTMVVAGLGVDMFSEKEAK